MNVTQILDIACRYTGKRTTGTEREDMLNILNDVFLDACGMVWQDQRIYRHRFDVSKNEYDIERHEELDFSGVTPPFPTLRDDDIQIPPMFKMMNLSYYDGANSSYPLRHVSETEILEFRRGYTTPGYSRVYSMAGTGILRLYPRPAVGDTLEITFVPYPPELVEGEDRPPAFWDEAVWDLSVYDDDRGVQSAPRQVPLQFHRNVLLNGTVAQGFDQDADISKVEHWQRRYEAGIEKMMMWHAQYGGEPNTVHNVMNQQFITYPDQYARGY